ncbi:MAG: hypothetical protein Q8O88_01530 [bacterium]|nr:hypothetical protein [bacterium]
MSKGLYTLFGYCIVLRRSLRHSRRRKTNEKTKTNTTKNSICSATASTAFLFEYCGQLLYGWSRYILTFNYGWLYITVRLRQRYDAVERHREKNKMKQATSIRERIKTIAKAEGLNKRQAEELIPFLLRRFGKRYLSDGYITQWSQKWKQDRMELLNDIDSTSKAILQEVTKEQHPETTSYAEMVALWNENGKTFKHCDHCEKEFISCLVFGSECSFCFTKRRHTEVITMAQQQKDAVTRLAELFNTTVAHC